ncbi:MAG: hypothetical protein GF381_03040 [Candidatus Pacebacteria bacterium]|nr:hypothetical protein [Candidatus Paceibacterota bacterium]
MKRPKKINQSASSALSLIEVLVVLGILAIILIIAIFYQYRHLAKARDAQRKEDMSKIKVAFEEYYNDNGCYPHPEVMLDCGQDTLDPYLKEIPCDPLTGDPYPYFSRLGNACAGYKILTDLEIDNDPDTPAIGCNFDEGCGWSGHPAYNYGAVVGDEMAGGNWELGGETDEEWPEYYFCIPHDAGEGGAPESGTEYVCHTLSYSSRLQKYDCPTSFDALEDCLARCESEEYTPGVSCDLR